MSKKRPKSIGILVVMFLLAAAGTYIWFSPKFERSKPSVEISQDIVWNTKEPLSINVEDSMGTLKDFELTLSSDKKSVVVGRGDFEPNTKRGTLLVKYPKSIFDKEQKILKLKISVTDNSLWNLFMGNESRKSINIQIDRTAPKVDILANSYSITYGGSAAVAFCTDEKHLKDIYVEVGKKRFEATEFKKDGCFAALLAWPLSQKSFEADVVAKDMASNTSRTIYLYTSEKNNTKSHISVLQIGL